MYGKLTELEKTIIMLIGKGFKNVEIAKATGKSFNTIGAYIYQMCKQNGAKNRTDLYRIMSKRGNK